jgi:nucleoid-associated protein YgaU
MHTKLHQTASKPVSAGRSEASRQAGDILTALALLLLGLLLCLIGLGLVGELKEAVGRRQETRIDDLLGIGSVVAGACLLGWWILSLVCAALSALLDRTGRTRAAAATRKLSPAFMQRLVLGALSVHLLAGPAAQAAVTGPGSGPEWAPTQGQFSSAPAIPATEEPAEGVAGAAAVEDQTPQAIFGTPATVPEPSAAPREVPSPEPAGAVAAPPSTFNPGWQPVPPIVDPGMLAAPAHRSAPGEGRLQDEGVTVQAGDTLWDIAARHLGPGVSDLDIALQWPRWYEANRGVIGQDPDALLPGQILQPPLAGRK